MTTPPYCFSVIFVALASAVIVEAQGAKPSDTTALVYVYRYRQAMRMTIRPSFYCDEKEVARVQNGRYLVLSLKLGRHEFRSNDKQSVVDLDLKATENYYIRLDLAPGLVKAHGRLTLIMPEQGQAEFKQLKPIDKTMVRDRTFLAGGFSPE